MYFEANAIHIHDFDININFYLGLSFLMTFIRQLLGLQVTKSLGPIISMIIVMFKDVGQFIIIWFIVLIAFSSVGFMTFQEVPSLRKFEDSFIYFFQAALGEFDLDIFAETYLPARPLLHKLGIYFVLVFVFINLVILINVVVAMMSDTYGVMSSVKLGQYSHSVIKTAPAYKPDKHYGALAFTPAPFAVISFLTIPYYLCVKDKARLEKFTMSFNMTFYFFFSILTSTIFLAFNLILLPFAYLKTCVHKIYLARAKIINETDVLSFVLLGLFKGIAAQVTDLWAFLKISWSMKKQKRTDKTFVINRSTF